jgi:TPR repeat protein
MNTPTNEIERNGAAIPPTSLEHDRSYADRGWGFAQLRMARRYRDGDGVEKDLKTARDYFLKAMATGEPGATEEYLEIEAMNAQTHWSLAANGSKPHFE